MKLERVDHPAPFGHPLNGMLKAWREPWLAEHYAERPDLDGLRRAAARPPADRARAPRSSRSSRARTRASANPRSDAAVRGPLAPRRDRRDVRASSPGSSAGRCSRSRRPRARSRSRARLRADLGVPGRPGLLEPVRGPRPRGGRTGSTCRGPTASPACARRSRTSAGRSTRSRSTTPSWRSRATRSLECGLDATAVARACCRSGASASRTGRRACSSTCSATSGLLIAEPAWFRGLTTPLIRRAIVEAGALHAAFVRSTEALRAHGIEPQVETRDRSMLFLVSQDGVRRRLLLRDDGWEEDKTGARFSEKDLLDRLERQPQDFSANVQLRAVIQQILLPVVGPGRRPGRGRVLRAVPGAVPDARACRFRR